jgi:hypothetical protein
MKLSAEWLERCMSAFEEISVAIFHGAQGVMVFEGKETGPHVGITICTHGDEPVGLSLLWYLLENPDVIVRGRLLVVVNNLAATRRFLHNEHRAQQEEGEETMPNPNPSTSIEAILMDENPHSDDYEQRRIAELKPIWKQFADGGLDLHCTYSETPPLAVVRNDELLLPQNQKIISGMPFDMVLTGMFSNLIGSPVVDYFGNETTSKMLYECGLNGSDESFSNAIYFGLSWLASFDVLNTELEIADSGNRLMEYYHVECSVVVPVNGVEYHYYDDYMISPLEWIEKDQILAESDEGHTITAPESGYAFLPQQSDDVLNAGEGLLFIARKQDMRH